MSIKKVLIYTSIIEAVTLYARFKMELNAPQGGIHHGYIGLLMLLFKFNINLALALVFSDIFHHVFLYAYTGNSEFP